MYYTSLLFPTFFSFKYIKKIHYFLISMDTIILLT